MTAGDKAAWERVGVLLRDRRFELGPEYARRGGLTRFCQDRDINYRLAWDAEHAYRTNISPGYIALLEDAYQLVPGSIRNALGGGGLTASAGGDIPQVPPGAPPVVRENWHLAAVREVWATALPEDVRLGMIASYVGDVPGSGRQSRS